MCQYSADEGTVGDWHVMRLGQFAVSGVGLVFVEATAVAPEGRITPGCVGLYCDENEAALARVVRFCRNYGSAKLGIRLAHAGRKASADLPWRGGWDLDDSAAYAEALKARGCDCIDVVQRRLLAGPGDRRRARLPGRLRVRGEAAEWLAHHRRWPDHQRAAG